MSGPLACHVPSCCSVQLSINERHEFPEGVLVPRAPSLEQASNFVGPGFLHVNLLGFFELPDRRGAYHSSLRFATTRILVESDFPWQFLSRIPAPLDVRVS